MCGLGGGEERGEERERFYTIELKLFTISYNCSSSFNQAGSLEATFAFMRLMQLLFLLFIWSAIVTWKWFTCVLDCTMDRRIRMSVYAEVRKSVGMSGCV